jgi:hypothetical protein
MPVLHLRDLSALGVIADVDPYNIPTNAFSYGLNVRFDDGSIERGVVFRNISRTGGYGNLLDTSGATEIGDMSGGGGLVTIDDGDLTETLATSATKATATTAYAGFTLAAAKKIQSVKVYGSDDQGFVNAANPNVTLTLYGKTGTAPASGTDGTAIGTLAAFADTANESAGRTITVDEAYVNTEYLHVWVYATHDGAAATMAVAEVDVYEYPDEPRFITSFVGDSGVEELFIGYENGQIGHWVVSGAETNFSILAYTPADTDGVYTSCQLGGLVYINREDRVPWFWEPSDTELGALTNWTGTWRCKVLRAYNDCLIAFNMTEGAVEYPTKIRTSNIATYGTVPDSWDETDLTKSATANVLAEIRGEIIEAQTLGPSMIIYSQQETWLMQADGSDDIYSYRRLFNDAGAINANCAVELEGKHYVFGYKDIWVHDGVGKESICNSRVRKQIFTNLDFSVSHYCFVLENPVLNELYFCYRDGAADDANFASVTGCNIAAVYNYKNNTWSFSTLPNVFSGTQMVIGNSVAYEDTSATYDELSVSYFNLTEESKRSPIMVGQANSTFTLYDRLYGVDMTGDQSIIPYSTDSNATLNWVLIKDGADLDELDLDLRGYKNIVAIYPQARLVDDSMTIEFCFGSADNFGEVATYEDYQSYDNSTYRKLDYKSGGRYLSMKGRGTSGGRGYFRLSGFDFDVEITGER